MKNTPQILKWYVFAFFIVIVKFTLIPNYSYGQNLGKAFDGFKKVKDAMTGNKTNDVAYKTSETTEKISPSKAGADINPNKYYTITNVAAGEELAVTFIIPEGIRRGAECTNASKSKVELKPLSKDSTQLWKFNPQNITPGNMYLIHNKTNGGTSCIIILVKPDSTYNPDDQYNRMTVSYHNNYFDEYWQVKKLDNGYFRIISNYGMPGHLNKPYDSRYVNEGQKDRWNEERSLEAVKIDGKIKLKQMKTADTPAQYWKLTPISY